MITGLKNKLIIISSPSGAGKTTLCKLLIKKMNNINLSISYTSRSKRLNEVNGKDYYFVSKKKFENLKEKNYFIETAKNFNNLYGSPYKNINKSIKEAFRVLKPGGKFLCLEFSKVQNENFNKIYKEYSKLIPKIGDLVVGEKEPYEYLIESIEKFINQDELLDCMIKNNFTNCKYRNFNGGIVAIHYGWKV